MAPCKLPVLLYDFDGFRYAFLGGLPDRLAKIREAPVLMTTSLVILALLCVGMGLVLVPDLRVAILDPAVEALAEGVGHTVAVMGH